MRLLNTSTYKLHNDDDEEVQNDPRYAILSHRWVGREITFQKLNSANLMDRSLKTPQLNKIRGACNIAREHTPPLEWLWIDTCCINKADAVEEARSINSMFEWYKNATVCYAYLHDVNWSAPSRQMFKSNHPERKQRDQESEWFERGWTLQELLAPRYLNFYDCGWRLMGSKKDTASVLQQITGIEEGCLTGDSKIQEASVAARMSWMAGRVTKEPEDIAYSMLGIFGINMTPQYGEGKKAFMRLQRTLMETSSDESIFAWAVPADGLACFRKHGHTPQWAPQTWGLLAPSPDCFKDSGDVVVIRDKIVPRLSGGYSWTQQGVKFSMPMKAGSEMTTVFGTPRKEVDLPLNCWRYNGGRTPLTVVLQLVKTGDRYERKRCDVLTQQPNAKPSHNRRFGIDQILTTPLTVTQPAFNDS